MGEPDPNDHLGVPDEVSVHEDGTIESWHKDGDPFYGRPARVTTRVTAGHIVGDDGKDYLAVSFGGPEWESEDVLVFPAPEVAGHFVELVAKAQFTYLTEHGLLADMEVEAEVIDEETG